MEVAWCAMSSCFGLVCRRCLGIFGSWWRAWCYLLNLLLAPNGALQSWSLGVGRRIILISKHLGRPVRVRRESCAHDGHHSWSCAHLLGVNSNIKGGGRLFVALMCLLSLPIFHGLPESESRSDLEMWEWSMIFYRHLIFGSGGFPSSMCCC